MKHKSIIALLFCMLLTLTILTACGGKTTEEPADTTAAEVVTEATVEETEAVTAYTADDIKYSCRDGMPSRFSQHQSNY